MNNKKLALISVYDKTNISNFAAKLIENNYDIISSGGTSSFLKKIGIPVISVEEYTNSPEVMGGRVKTLHPKIHGGILSRGECDLNDLERLGARQIDIVVVNLYPFEKVSNTPGSTYSQIIENIDIGGPSMLRSAAKNHARVMVVCDPNDYELVIEKLNVDDNEYRAQLAAKVFAHTAAYDAAISSYFTKTHLKEFPKHITLPFELAYNLRYGENSHQRGAFYVERNAIPGSLALAKNLNSCAKELSFNNFIDVDAALNAVREFDRPAVVIVKHTNPCGVAETDKLIDAYKIAFNADSLSAFGGVVALNREVDEPTAYEISKNFTECVIAPSFTENALFVLKCKRNLRILATGDWKDAQYSALQYKHIDGGIVVQDRDNTAANEVRNGKIVSNRVPTEQEIKSLEFSWKVCKHVKSNAIVIANETQTFGIGAGQMSRVISVEIACKKAGNNAFRSVLASDAFFPFPDGIEIAAKAGITAIVQPGGSVKDKEVIKVANQYNLAMIFTGVRHFKH
jgi:phosphoribosylaminoimidazolecarboxamide formyltransferase/IMP cyclohydrolase